VRVAPKSARRRENPMAQRRNNSCRTSSSATRAPRASASRRPVAGASSPLRVITFVAVGAALGAMGLLGYKSPQGRRTAMAGRSSPPAKSAPTSYYDLLAMSPDELAGVDIALGNLLCAKGLPGAENLDIPAVLKQLDAWAAKVKFDTERHLYRVTDPRYAEHYGHSEARLRAEFIVQTLQEECGVHYNPDRITTADWRNSQDLFLHGLVGSANGGTCSSMPLLYVAIGRRLGYPMKLVLADSHIFCRWDSEKERLNIEGTTNGGINFHPDEYYRTWPKPLADAEIERGEFLRSLTPTEELSSFLIDRGMCLDMNGRNPEARAAFAEAHRLMPQSAFHLRQLAIAMRQVFGSPGSAQRQQADDAWLKQMTPPDPQPGRQPPPWAPPVPGPSGAAKNPQPGVPGMPNPQPAPLPGNPGGRS
jgi:hypothetical protein